MMLYPCISYLCSLETFLHLASFSLFLFTLEDINIEVEHFLSSVYLLDEASNLKYTTVAAAQGSEIWWIVKHFPERLGELD